jgi:hypothetical protein
MVELTLPTLTEMKKGQTVTIPVSVKAASPFRSAVLGLKFDSAKLAVRSVTFGDVFGSSFAGRTVTPFINQNGKMFVSLALENGEAPMLTGIVAYVQLEALADGVPAVTLERDVLNFMSAQGKVFQVKF